MFKGFVLLMIMANAIFIGVSTHITMVITMEEYDRTPGEVGDVAHLLPLWIIVLDYSFTSFFLCELLARLLALEREFFTGSEWTWNIFDAVLVATSVADAVLSAVYLNLSFVRVLRVLRLARTLRMVRLVRAAAFFRTLRLMLLAIVTSSMPLIWAFICVMGIIYVFGVVFQQGATVHISTAGGQDSNVPLLEEHFDSMPQTLLTLFMCVTGGVSWKEVVDPLISVHWLYGILFVCFISMMLLAALNIITGIFVNDALELTKADNDLMLQTHVTQTTQNLVHLQNLFHEIDTNDDGKLTIKEFKEGLEHDSVQVAFAKIDLEVADAVNLFRLLDVDGDGELEIDEFVIGCLRFRGTANAVNTESLMQRVEIWMQTSMTAQRNINRKLNKLEALLTALDRRIIPSFSLASNVSVPGPRWRRRESGAHATVAI